MFVLARTFVGFSAEQILRPIIPLIVIGRGGDVVLVGVIVAMHSLPSVLLRPFIGRLADSWRHTQLLTLSALVLAVAPAGVLIPGILALAPARFVQGTGWALYSVSTQALMARLAPAHRRGEASGYYQAMPALAMSVAPVAGIGLFVATGEVGPVVVAVALGFIALVITLRVTIPVAPDDWLPSSAKPATIKFPLVSEFVEPSALPALFILTMFLPAQALFLVFAPVYAAAIDAPTESLAGYYLTWGIVMLLSQLVGGRVSDRVGRGVSIRIGCVVATVGLATAAAGNSLLTLAAGASVFAIGASVVTPTLSAMTMDRAPRNRLGSAMATYSIGYQLATGASSLIWGIVISTGGFSLAFFGAIGLQAVTFVSSLRLVQTTRAARR